MKLFKKLFLKPEKKIDLINTEYLSDFAKKTCYEDIEFLRKKVDRENQDLLEVFKKIPKDFVFKL